MKYILYVDSSILGISLGMASQAEPSNLLWQGSKLQREVSASLISALFHEGVKSLGIKRQNISHLVISEGPGSFTGIRIGLAWAYGLSCGLSDELKLLGVSSFVSLSQYYYSLRKKKGTFGVFLPATRSQGFYVSIEGPDHSLSPISIDCQKITQDQYRLLEKDELLFVEPGVLWEEFLNKRNLSYDSLSLTDFARASLVSLAKEVEQKALLDQAAVTRPKANYIRFSAAEEQLKKSKGESNC